MPSSSFTDPPTGGPTSPPYSVPSGNSADSPERGSNSGVVMYPPPPVYHHPYDGSYASQPPSIYHHTYPNHGAVPPPGYPPTYPPYNAGQRGAGWSPSIYDHHHTNNNTISSYSNSLYPSQRPRDTATTDGLNEHNKGESILDHDSRSKNEEIEMEEVRPIQTDFHFFVLQWKDKLLREAEAEVDFSLHDYDDDYKAQHRMYLVNSNLNCRLMKKWEGFAMDERDDYFQKEEDDRRRFMTEDEVISRHCFTLTARVRSPTKKYSEEEVGGGAAEKRPQPESSPTTEDETPPKKNRVERSK